ncbi:sigma-54-dependent transcriptional regulator [Wolinella succinogenes]|uniref:SIGNAL-TRANSDUCTION REGULATORY PROTEIN n=1 Tax=Wolinella succinogenes (strain ATCC 29543 / DSM 1740 / CCUG 13145 / JCM 31913 / LMG 7466 / NCTC 11488 / FDC 602W) TaxID=273121 RepID=Q7MAA8_WOLSU|nr:sigma-54 dependent transcriptional regulator [Wolinella succinogenes]NLU33940.1 sigma-54-dependent Fis family transcriptional regulator [Wolinella succinogenes]CAE09515.1 SIGNAL-TRANSDUCTION REGULATORY PROTEIN [Wolinella succinogenes]VEG81728.1 Nitrogen assimilation regulatory protein [Wolinella succinogenes]HCZ18366.1 sigma-54-dependent Fis family transcriptional regulator [Helicobacter sp.]
MKIAIVEDDINMRKSLEIALGEYPEFEILSFKSAKDALKKLDETIDLIVTDINMPGMDGIEFLERLEGRYEAIIITGNATLNKAIESIRLGVKDFLTKPFEIETLVRAIRRSQKVQAIQKSRPKSSPTSASAQGAFIASSPALEGALRIIQKAALTDASILLLGESGVGKELFASHIHALSPRKNSPFIAINMAAIPDNLLESELFGYEKGAFTDATEGRAGKIEAANGGTLFLDEIGEMPLGLQAKILRVLQEKEVVRLGSHKPIKVEFRVVAATNANIKEKIRLGEFREDLFFRLQTIPVKIPPLRERREEIMPLCTWRLQKVCEQYDLNLKSLSSSAQRELLGYEWPGNIRELLSVVERAAILSEGEEISCEDLFLSSRESGGNRVENLERDLLQEVLLSASTLQESAQILGISEEMLKNKMAKYAIQSSLFKG